MTPPAPSFWARTVTCRWPNGTRPFEFEAGIIVLDTEARQLDHREGSIVYEGEELLGGWPRSVRKDRTRPSYEEVKLAEYDTGKSL